MHLDMACQQQNIRQKELEVDAQATALSAVTRKHMSRQSRLNPRASHEVPTRVLDNDFARETYLERQRDECRRS